MKSFLQEVSYGLSKKNKKLSSKWFYDFHGSKLFERITRLKEYYPTRTERRILKDNKIPFLHLDTSSIRKVLITLKSLRLYNKNFLEDKEQEHLKFVLFLLRVFEKRKRLMFYQSR